MRHAYLFVIHEKIPRAIVKHIKREREWEREIDFHSCNNVGRGHRNIYQKLWYFESVWWWWWEKQQHQPKINIKETIAILPGILIPKSIFHLSFLQCAHTKTCIVLSAHTKVDP